MPDAAYVFPGQGAQKVGMGKDLHDSFASARRVFQEADSALGFSLSRLCFEGPADELKQTVNAQPAVMVVSLACLAAAREALGSSLTAPSFVAGHSLGEYTALVASGALALDDGVNLVRERGRLMQQAGLEPPGGMMAALGMDMALLEAACRQSGAEIANINCPGQVVISGSREDLEKAVKAAQAAGGKKFLPLEVSGAFHSRWMRPAYDGLKQAMERCHLGALTAPLVGNVGAGELRSPGEVRQELLSQLCGCVQWQRSVEHMASSGVTEFIELGPGKVLTGLVKRTVENAVTRNIGCCADISGWHGTS